MGDAGAVTTNDDELANLKIGSQIDVYLERIESFKGEIVSPASVSILLKIQSDISFALYIIFCKDTKINYYTTYLIVSNKKYY